MPLPPSSPPIRLTLTALSVQFSPRSLPLVVLSPLCATRVFWPCPSLLSLPFSLVSCCTLTLPTLLFFCPLSLGFAFVPRLSSHGEGGGLLAGWIVALIVDGLGDGLLGSDDRDFPHPAGTVEPPMGSTVANAILVGPAL